MQLNEPELKRMEQIHPQAMRKLLNGDTTYIIEKTQTTRYT